MENAGPFMIALTALLAVPAFIFWAGGKASAKARRNGEALAARLGLGFEPKRPALGWFHAPPRGSGTIRGKSVEFYTYSTGSGKARTQWAAITVKPTAAGQLSFKLSRQNFATRVSELFGAKEIQVGDAGFDQRWFVQTNQPDFFRAALLPELRAKLDVLEAQGLTGDLMLKDGVVQYRERGSFYDEALCVRIAAMAEVGCDFADIAEVWAEHPSA